MNINWYPGHIAKAEKKLREQINLVDVVIEVCDARIPLSSMYPDVKRLIGDKPRLILLNKSDLADENKSEKLVKSIRASTKCSVILTSTSNSKDIQKIVSKTIELSQPVIAKLVQRGLLPRATRAMVIGMPNVGKSSIVNKLIRKSKAKTGAKAGITRQQQWVRIHPRIDLLDTPGIIPVKQVEQDKAVRLAFVNSIGENAYENEEVANELLRVVEQFYPGVIRERYGLEDSEEISLRNIALKRNWIVKNSMPDIVRCAQNLLTDFREGRMGRLTLDV